MKSFPHSALVLQVLEKLGNSKKNAKLRSFAPIYLKGLPDNEFENINLDDFVVHLASMFDFIQERPEQQVVKIRVTNPNYTRHSVVEVLTNDQPFIMDTLWEELRRQGLEIHHSFHPIMLINRDGNGQVQDFDLWTPEDIQRDYVAESVVHIEFDRQAEEDTLRDIEHRLKQVLDDARRAVRDFAGMTGKLQAVIADSEKKHINHPNAMEDIAFLRWLLDGNFVFLGYRHYEIFEEKKQTFMRLERGTGLGLLSIDEESSVFKPRKINDLPPNIAHYIQDKRLLTITRALDKSTVHRRVDMDFVGVKSFDKQGKVTGEHRFVGLFSSKAYNANARDIPILRQKIQAILQRESHLGLHTHNYKALVNILETYPREELFQISVEDLHRISMGILHLNEREKVRLFIRRSDHERQITAMVFIPRETMSSNLRRKIMDILMVAYNGEDIESNVNIGTSPLARLFFKIRTHPPCPPDIHDRAVERLIIDAAVSWEDNFKKALIEKHNEAQGLKLYHRYLPTLRSAYRENTPTAIALDDVDQLETIFNTDDAFRLSIHGFDVSRELRLRIFKNQDELFLSDIMPLFDSFGLFVKTEHATLISLNPRQTAWIHDFTLKPKDGQQFKSTNTKTALTRALLLGWQNKLESDSLNALVLMAGVSLPQVIILRALVAYLQQTNSKYAPDYVHQTLIKHHAISGQLLELFDARFNPSRKKARAKTCEKIYADIEQAMKDVSVLDEDIILRRLRGVIMAMVRTNFWQQETVEAPLAFKIESAKVAGLPKPLPLFEIFVYSARFAGVHLRGGRIARGGLRWSDRPADFRTEVLGLMKTQMTKNAVIVPVGSKGGFVLKQAPCDLKDQRSCDPNDLRKELETCYRLYIRSLLSITDNIVGEKTLPPVDVVCHDKPDPYLVVAADKGTATFSDTANEEALNASYWQNEKGTAHKGFWLGDAFASGGSNGYDHKKMAITARGAWESVKHHFRLLGKDIQQEDFTVLGIGDMAGDVFGNGMLLSKHIKLQAAFNHMHIFLDPNPNSAKSWTERKRLFDKPRSSWADYDKKLISKGGGVFSRFDKTIPLSPEVQAMLGIKESELSPPQLIKAILQMKVELFWNGGIGTFVRGRHEGNDDVGDRQNDEIRITAQELNAKVIGEGGNLGFTQQARIEFSRRGGLINTDAIDNSAGVDCSDHEVNIKILLNLAMERESLTEKARNKLLADMTNTVADLCLQDNYLQAQAITLKHRDGVSANETNANLIRYLERKGMLDRFIEALPSQEDIEQRTQNGETFARPEIAVLLAYAKMDIFNNLLKDRLIDAEGMENYLYGYFPQVLQKKYQNLMDKHPLRREIIATVIANDVVNRMGLTFLNRMRDELGQSTAQVTAAYVISSQLLNAADWWQRIKELDAKIDMDVQLDMLEHIKKLVEYTAFWFLRHHSHELNDVQRLLHRYEKPFEQVLKHVEDCLTPDMKKRNRLQSAAWQKRGLQKTLAQELVLTRMMNAAPDVSTIALNTGYKVPDVMHLHFAVGTYLCIDKLHTRARQIPVNNNWDRVGILSILDDLYTYQKQATTQVVQLKNNKQSDKEAIESWSQQRQSAVRTYLKLTDELLAEEHISHSMLNVALGQLKGLLMQQDT